MQILRAYLEQFFCQEAVATQRSAPRHLPGTHNLILPSSSNPLDYGSVIEALPEIDPPALFGLPPNVNRAVGRARGVTVTAQLKQITASQVTWLQSPALPAEVLLQRSAGLHKNVNRG